MRAGMLRDRVTVQTLTPEVKDTHGGFTDGAVSIIVARVAASVAPLAGRELERAVQIDPRASHTVTLRFRPDITVRQQVIFHDPDRGDRTFEVAQVINPNSDRRELQLLCKEAL